MAVARETSRRKAGSALSRRARYRIPSMPYSTPLVICIVSSTHPRRASPLVSEKNGVVKSMGGCCEGGLEPGGVQGGRGGARPLIPPLAGTDAEGPHLAVEVAALQAEQLRGAHHVAPRLLQLHQDELLLEVLAPLPQGAEPLEEVLPRRPVSPQAGRQIGQGDDVAGHQDDQALHHVPELADVSRPAVGPQGR